MVVADTSNLISTQVVIVGAGPVGLTLALDLAQRGIKVCVVEQGSEAEAGDAKCNTVSARTMETFRRLGVSEKVRAAGLPDDYPTDAVFTDGFGGTEITRIELPSRNERMRSNGRKMDNLFKHAFDVGRMPLTIIDAEADCSYFRHDFLLVRGDQHICWRGNALPDDMTAVVEKLTHRSG